MSLWWARGDPVEVVGGRLIHVFEANGTACVQDGADRKCTYLALPGEARLPPIGTEVRAGLVTVPETVISGGHRTEIEMYIYIVPR